MKATKRIGKKLWRAKTKTTIESLPQDLIVEIVAQLASQSAAPISDLDNLRMTCKMFGTAAKAKLVGQRISLDKERSLHWWNKERYFAILRSCAAAGNLEACFILGLENVFNLERLILGLYYLEKAMVGGHEAATYTMGILLFGERRTRQIGMELLNKIGAGGTDDSETKISSGPYTVRMEVLEALRMITMNKRSPGRRKRCANPTCGAVEGWDSRRVFCSELCKWTFEYFQFYAHM